MSTFPSSPKIYTLSGTRLDHHTCRMAPPFARLQTEDSCLENFGCNPVNTIKDPRRRSSMEWETTTRTLHKTKSVCLDQGHNASEEPLWIDDWYSPHLGLTVLDQTKTHTDPGVVEGYQQGEYCKIDGVPIGKCLRVAENVTPLGSCISSGAFSQPSNEGQFNMEIKALDSVEQPGSNVSSDVFVRLIQRCVNKKDMVAGTQVHRLIVNNGCDSDAFVGSQLIRMYALFGNLWEANEVFIKLLEPDVVAWSAIILAHAKLGKSDRAIKLYYQMLKAKVEPDGHVFVAVLKACATIEQGQQIHADVIASGLELDKYVGSTLVDMYSNCGCLRDAHMMFDRLPNQDSVIWSALIAGYIEHGHGQEAIQLFQKMRQEGLEPTKVTFLYIVKACSCTTSLEQGKGIHTSIIESGFESDIIIGNSLVDMYAKCGNLQSARVVFERLPRQNWITWSALIAGYTQQGHGQEALDLFIQMEEEGVEPDHFTFACILKACASIAALIPGKQMHTRIVERGLESDVFIGTTLIDMYAKCGSLQDAPMVFEKLPNCDTVTWNVLIAGYIQHGQGQDAVQLFQQMELECVQPDRLSFVSILKVCASILALEQGKQVHANIIKNGIELDLSVGSSLIDMYVKCQDVRNAQMVFNRLPEQDVFTWSALIVGYAQHDHSQTALELFQWMQEDGVEPNQVTFLGILKACSNLASLEQGKLIHGSIIESGLEMDIAVANNLIDMYVKCGSLQNAHAVFDRLPKQDVVTWSALIAGYAESGHGQEALHIFERMQQDGMEPNKITYLCILKACSTIAASLQGKVIHGRIIENGLESDIFINNTLVDMYAKCGCLQDAHAVFDEMSKKDTVTWSSLIAGYTRYGHGQEALRLCQQMQQDGLEPDQSIFISIVKACSSVMALQQGRQIHTCIVKNGFELDICVSSTLMDMYIKCGSLKDATTLFERLSKRDTITWSSLIAGYAQNNDYRMALHSFLRMQEIGLEPDDVTFICLLSACNHVGLVDEGLEHLKSMIEDHRIMPRLEHYNCLADLLGRVGCLNEAEDLLETIPFGLNIVGWSSLLSSCKKHGSVDQGRRCFDKVMVMDSGNAAAYALMSSIYSQAGMLAAAGKIEIVRRRTFAWKRLARAFIEIDSQVHDFTVGDRAHPQSDDIYAKLKLLSIQAREKGYMSHIDLISCSMSDQDREDALCGHCEKLAIAFGLISTPPGATIRVAKNLRVCADCHFSIKTMSRIEMRDIIIADTYCIHHFKDGACSCKDYD